MAFLWRADDGPLIVVFESSLPQKNGRVGPPLKKLFGSAHESFTTRIATYRKLIEYDQEMPQSQTADHPHPRETKLV